MKLFLGIGECMVELSGAGEGLWRQGFAGDVLNTLWYARAGLPAEWRVQFHTAVGTDRMSAEMVAFIEGAGIACEAVPRIAGRVPGLYAIRLEGGERSFVYWRDTSAARCLMQQPELLLAKLSRADLVYYSGITLAILPPGDADRLIAAIVERRKEGSIVAFDPNIRPRLWDDPDRMRRTVTLAAATADVVLPSFSDEAAAFGDPTPEATARRYWAGGARLVVVKNGDQPTLAAGDGAPEAFPVAPIADVVDTTAAGDSFNGAFLSTLAQGGEVAAAVRAGQACAGRVVRYRGALVPFEELER